MFPTDGIGSLNADLSPHIVNCINATFVLVAAMKWRLHLDNGIDVECRLQCVIVWSKCTLRCALQVDNDLGAGKVVSKKHCNARHRVQRRCRYEPIDAFCSMAWGPTKNNESTYDSLRIAL